MSITKSARINLIIALFACFACTQKVTPVEIDPADIENPPEYESDDIIVPSPGDNDGDWYYNYYNIEY